MFVSTLENTSSTMEWSISLLLCTLCFLFFLITLSIKFCNHSTLMLTQSLSVFQTLGKRRSLLKFYLNRKLMSKPATRITWKTICFTRLRLQTMVRFKSQLKKRSLKRNSLHRIQKSVKMMILKAKNQILRTKQKRSNHKGKKHPIKMVTQTCKIKIRTQVYLVRRKSNSLSILRITKF